MHKFLPAQQSSYPFHVAVCGNTRGKVQTNPLAAKEDAEKLGDGAKVIPLLGDQAKRYIEIDRLYWGNAA